MPQIKCTVSDCYFNDRKADLCVADSIEVAVKGARGARTDFAGGSDAGVSSNTECVTYRPRSS